MISEGPVLPLVRVEVLAPQGGFILGRSLLGVDDLGNGDEEIQWTNYLPVARNATIQRGGKRAGVVQTMDVGTLNISLVNAGDPADDPAITPNTPIRLVAVQGGNALYTGTVGDIDVTYSLDKATGETSTFVQIVASDAVQQHANTTRYGSIAPAGYERWETRIARLALSSQAPINAPTIDEPAVKYSL
jgi:hypothetical protein